jgi:hypothetical protein
VREDDVAKMTIPLKMIYLSNLHPNNLEFRECLRKAFSCETEPKERESRTKVMSGELKGNGKTCRLKEGETW